MQGLVIVAVNTRYQCAASWTASGHRSVPPPGPSVTNTNRSPRFAPARQANYTRNNSTSRDGRVQIKASVGIDMHYTASRLRSKKNDMSIGEARTVVSGTGGSGIPTKWFTTIKKIASFCIDMLQRFSKQTVKHQFCWLYRFRSCKFRPNTRCRLCPMSYNRCGMPIVQFSRYEPVSIAIFAFRCTVKNIYTFLVILANLTNQMRVNFTRSHAFSVYVCLVRS